MGPFVATLCDVVPPGRVCASKATPEYMIGINEALVLDLAHSPYLSVKGRGFKHRAVTRTRAGQ